MADRYLALQVVMMPKDANPHVVLHAQGQYALYSTIFGGIILSYLDQAGAIGARHAVVAAGGSKPTLVTVAMNRVEFNHPVQVGDVVRFLTHVKHIGRTSITMHVDVEAERAMQPFKPVTEAEVVYVNIDPTRAERRPVPLFPQNETV